MNYLPYRESLSLGVMLMRVLAIDVGSSSVKAGFWDGGRFRSRVRVRYETRFEGMRAELDARVVIRAVMKAGREVGAAKAEVVAFCALSSGVVVTDAKGKTRAAVITHQDRRSVAEARGLVQELGKRWLLGHTGNLPYPGGIGSSTVSWLRRHERGAFHGNYRVGQLSSLVGWALTGEWAIDPSQAVFLGLWDIAKWRWSERMCGAVGIAVENLPRCGWAEDRIGGLKREVAQAWGMKAGVPVVGGFVDTSAAVLQTPMRPGQLAHGAGSTDVLAMCVERPQPIEGVLTRPVGVRGRNGEGVWLAVRTIAAAGSALAWARRELFRELNEGAWEEVLHAACAEEEEGVRCMPAFSGERTAIEQKEGALFEGVRLATTREEMLRGIVAGLVRESARNYGILAGIHRPGREVFSMGGAGDLAEAMHRAWPGRHRFKRLEGDSLAGLVMLAERGRV